MSGREIGLQCVGLLFERGHKESAIKLSKSLNEFSSYILLSLSDVDWEIQSVLEELAGWDCMSVSSSSNGCFARFYFDKEY